MYVDFTPHWAGDPEDSPKQFFGEERWRNMMDYTAILEDGPLVGFSSDTVDPFGLTRISPFLGIQIGMTRVEPQMLNFDFSLYEDGCRPPASAKFTLKQLLNGYTMVNARRMHLDDITGSIEVGKFANFVVLNEDIFECPEDEIVNIDAEFSLFEGKKLKIPNPVDDLGFY